MQDTSEAIGHVLHRTLTLRFPNSVNYVQHKDGESGDRGRAAEVHELGRPLGVTANERWEALRQSRHVLTHRLRH